jgi:hypothetical protein
LRAEKINKKKFDFFKKSWFIVKNIFQNKKSGCQNHTSKSYECQNC